MIFYSDSLMKSLFIFGCALVLRIIANIFIVAFVNRITQSKNGNVNRMEQRVKSLSSVIRNVINIGIFGVAFVMILSEWGINIAPILTGAGVVGLAVGFGAQTLVRDAMTGFFILVDNEYNVGDKVKIAGFEGTVVAMHLRTTVLKQEDGVVHIIPNSQIGTISKNIVKN